MLLEILVPVAVSRAGAGADELPTMGYPAVAAVLCAVGLVTFAGVSAARRAAAGWLLLASRPRRDDAQRRARRGLSPLFDVVTSTGYPGMLAASTLALAMIPGRGHHRAVPREVPLAGVVVSYCLSFGVSCCSAPGRAAGRW